MISFSSGYKQVLLNGETWTASNINGKTVYISGPAVVDGPVVLAAGTTLLVQSGAVLSGLLAAGAAGSPSITVMSGGATDRLNRQHRYSQCERRGIHRQ